MLNQDMFLLVDDDESFRSNLAKALTRRNHKVVEAYDVNSALPLLKEHVFQYAVIDLRMPGESGLMLIKPIREASPNAKILVLTGYGSIPTATEAMRLGAFNYLTKPVDTDEILHQLNANHSKLPLEINYPSLDQVENDHIQRVLQDFDGNVTQAAKMLKIHRRSLQRKLNKLQRY